MVEYGDKPPENCCFLFLPNDELHDNIIWQRLNRADYCLGAKSLLYAL
ncbi:MAG: hypothetical protein ACI8VC_000156 [Candidatus Endobugula sp.]|jgi:hypothetical protein